MNPQCPHCRADGKDVIQSGRYFRSNDSRHVCRFKCHQCQRFFSRATLSARYRQKKRRINHPIKVLLAAGVSMRRIAKLLRISRTTVARRLQSLAAEARSRECTWRDSLAPLNKLQFDDLITIEHTKLKPLSVTVVVDPERWKIAGFCVAQIPANGALAAKSREKYGPRRDRSRMARRKLLSELKPIIAEDATFITDAHKDYEVMIKTLFPTATHKQHRSIPACVTGQGELKRSGNDPLFCINHVLAMLRANINRLFRRTWCTTKLPERLADHTAIFVDYYNRELSPRR